jgi:hypothetical protein
MKLKLNEQGAVVLNDGKPVYVRDDGSEMAFDAARAVAKINELTGEAKGHREAKEAAEAKLSVFGDLDPARAREALEAAASGKGKPDVDALKAEIAKSYEPIVQERDALKSQLNGLALENAFKGSKFVSDKLAIPADFAQAYFAKMFKVENGKTVPVNQDGNPIYSRNNPGEVASFDEALEIMVSGHPHRDSILKGSNATGSGAEKAKTVSDGGQKTVTRTQFDAMSHPDRATFAKDGGKVID